ncbi:unnamed protein product [Anisakis simplex]|uniref:Uncharacterized protein n=1 Tax=Anisakis simplex TaxID=6269 RepID=A0A3P6SYE6_ANISI|nr:unnamed protein product [Anisakis simplex]
MIDQLQYRCPTSFLATFARLPHEERLMRCDGYIESSEEYFFERSAKVFEPIYDFLATGHFHRHGDICAERLYQELDYWKINGNMFAPCCMPNVDGSGDEDGEATGSLPSGECGNNDHYDEIRCSNLRRQLWLLMEDPSSSTSAKGFALVSISMVIVSVTGMILASLPDIQADSVNNSSAIDEENLSLKPHLLLDYIELVCLIWFTIEYLVRFAVCTKKCEFACKPLNIIDSLTIIPFYLEMILHVAGLGADTIGEFRGLAMVMRGVRVMRVARIFKLARYSSGLKSFGMTVKTR